MKKFPHKSYIAMTVFYTALIAIAVMSTGGCKMRDLAGKLDLSRLWAWEKPETKSPASDAIPAEKIIWLGRDVSGYKITEATTNAVYDFRARLVHYNGSPGIMRNWKQVKGSVGNPWILIPAAELGRQGDMWYAASWEWITRNNPHKPMRNLNGHHIKQFSVIPATWEPVSGHTYGRTWSGIARGPYTGTQERAPIDTFVWP